MQSRPWAAAQLKLLVMFVPLHLMSSSFLQGLKATSLHLFFFSPLRHSGQLIDETPVKRPQQQPAQVLRCRLPHWSYRRDHSSMGEVGLHN